MKRKRKSPVRHSVNSYMREGKRVNSHIRGRGTPTITVKRRKIEENKPTSFTVNFKYSNRKGDGESVIVIATDYHKALDEAFEEKRDPRNPIAVEVIDPSLGTMLKIMARGVGKAVKLGAKYSYITGKTVGKEAAHAVAKSYRELRLRRLIDEAYSTDRVTRIMARGKLRQRYPEITAICDFSKEKN